MKPKEYKILPAVKNPETKEIIEKESIVIPLDSLIELRNKYHKQSFIFGREKNLNYRDCIQSIIDCFQK